MIDCSEDPFQVNQLQDTRLIEKKELQDSQVSLGKAHATCSEMEKARLELQQSLRVRRLGEIRLILS